MNDPRQLMMKKKAEVNSARCFKLKTAPVKRYFSWIANFGVVPLLRQFFLRLAPCLERLALRLFSVTLVFETISYPWLKWMKCFGGILPTSPFSVKKRPCPGVILSIILMLFVLPRSNALAESIILAPGEHWEQNFPQMRRYTIGNHDIISHRFEEKNKRLILKGLKLGHTELVVWNQRKAKETFQIFVISKQKELGLLQIAQGLKALGLQVDLNHQLIQVNGTLATMAAYQQYLKIIAQTSLPVVVTAHLAAPLRNQIIADIYQQIMDEFYDEVACQAHHLKITCTYAEGHIPPEPLRQKLTNTWGVDWFKSEDDPRMNFRLKLKLLQLEKLDGTEINLGIHHLQAPLEDYFTLGLEQIVRQNATLLAAHQLNFSTIAAPEIILRPEHPVTIKIGTEVPYEIRRGNTITYDWKFVGLNLNLTLHLAGDLLRLDYKTSFSAPAADMPKSVKDNSQASSITATLYHPVEMFDVALKTNQQQNNALPFIGKIPFLKNLFSSHNQNAQNKRIIALALLEREELPVPPAETP